MNGILTDGRTWNFVRIERDTLYHFQIALTQDLDELAQLLHYISCFAKGEPISCDQGQWPPVSVVPDPALDVEHVARVPPVAPTVYISYEVLTFANLFIDDHPKEET